MGHDRYKSAWEPPRMTIVSRLAFLKQVRMQQKTNPGHHICMYSNHFLNTMSRSSPAYFRKKQEHRSKLYCNIKQQQHLIMNYNWNKTKHPKKEYYTRTEIVVKDANLTLPRIFIVFFFFHAEIPNSPS